MKRALARNDGVVVDYPDSAFDPEQDEGGDHDTVVCKPWAPTAEEFSRYKAREVELAKKNIGFLIGAGYMQSPERLRTMTVASGNTLQVAFQEVLRARAVERGEKETWDEAIESSGLTDEQKGHLRVTFGEVFR